MLGTSEPAIPTLPGHLIARVGSLYEDVSIARMRATLGQLPAPRVRAHSAASMERADAMICEAFTEAGWLAELDPFEARDVKSWTSEAEGSAMESAARLDGVNVVAVREGQVPDALVFVAHHDTVPGSGGADDNGSGVAALLELARLLGDARFRLSVVLAAVDHEELGFVGSRRLVSRLTAQRPVAGAFVFEMLGYTSAEPRSQLLPASIGLLYPGQTRKIRARDLRGDFTSVLYQRSGVGLATRFAQGLAALAGAAEPVLLRAPTDISLLGPVLGRAVPLARDFARSDHVPFWEKRLPAVQITDTANFRNPHYHRASDLPQTLDYQCIAGIVAASALAAEQVAGRLAG